MWSLSVSSWFEIVFSQKSQTWSLSVSTWFEIVLPQTSQAWSLFASVWTASSDFAPHMLHACQWLVSSIDQSVPNVWSVI